MTGKKGSKYNGVSWHALRKKWLASVYNGTKLLYFGLFTSERQAAIAFDRYCIENNLDRELNFILR